MEPLGPGHAARPAEASDQPAAVAHQLAAGQLVHLAPSLDAARGDTEPAVRRGQRTWVEAGVRDEPVTPLLRQRVDLEDLDSLRGGWLGCAMTTVALFHSVLGVRQGVLDAAERLRQDGHDVLVVDLFDGRTFDDYPPAMSFAEKEVGREVLMQRAAEAVAELPDGFVSAGFSLGCVMAVHVATQRRVSGVLMVAGAIPVSAFGDNVRWPAGVPAQTHSTRSTSPSSSVEPPSLTS